MSPALNGDVSPTIQNGHESNSVAHVAVIGAGPAGLMLATNLARWGIKVQVLDDRLDRTATGRADGLQPKTIETLRQMKLVNFLLDRGVKFYDICFWNSEPGKPLTRTAREIHYPPVVDVLDPYMILTHQGEIEKVFLDDMATRGASVQRRSRFVDYVKNDDPNLPVEIKYEDLNDGSIKSTKAQYVVGCDGAHSRVRRSLPDCEMEGESVDVFWGVLDGEIETDFPDLWSKAVVNSKTAGGILIIPRERNLSRLYIELQVLDPSQTMSREKASQEFVMQRASEIISPFHLKWKSVEWFGIYQIGQRVASRFIDSTTRVFVTGDASHTHSPKAGQGMNVSMHDSWNLAWKLKLTIQGLALPSLLPTYEQERRKIAKDLINFDQGHANAFVEGDAKALAENFKTNIRFISGVGAEYAPNICNLPDSTKNGGGLKPGSLLLPAKVTRYIDANPVDIQLDIPMLGQFRIFFLTKNFLTAKPFLDSVCEHISKPESFLSRISAKAASPRSVLKIALTHQDEYILPQRYTVVSSVFTYAFVTSTPKPDMEITDLPPLLRESKWTFYLDDGGLGNRLGQSGSCMDKWVGELKDGDVAIVNVRPDGYVGCIGRWEGTTDGKDAGEWLEGYYGGFLDAS